MNEIRAQPCSTALNQNEGLGSHGMTEGEAATELLSQEMDEAEKALQSLGAQND